MEDYIRSPSTKRSLEKPNLPHQVVHSLLDSVNKPHSSLAWSLGSSGTEAKGRLHRSHSSVMESNRLLACELAGSEGRSKWLLAGDGFCEFCLRAA
jgi:hypothetical protein